MHILANFFFFFAPLGYTSVRTPEDYENTSIYNHVKKECVSGDQA